MMTKLNTFHDSKDPLETITVTFDVTQMLAFGETVTGTPTVDATVLSGTDPSPNAIISGATVVNGEKIMQRVVGGMNHTFYLLRCTFTTSQGRTYVVPAALLVLTITS